MTDKKTKDDGAQIEDAGSMTDANTSDESTKTFTQAEVDAMISKTAAKVEDKLSQKYEQMFSSKLEEAKHEAVQIAKMSEDEQKQKHYETWEKRLKEDEKRLEVEKLTAKVKQSIVEAELPIAFSEALVLLGDYEKAKDKIAELSIEYKNAIAEAAKAKYRTEPPKASTAEIGTTRKAIFAKELNEREKKLSEAPDPWHRNL